MVGRRTRRKAANPKENSEEIKKKSILTEKQNLLKESNPIEENLEAEWKKIEKQVEERCETMMKEAERKVEELQREFQVQLMFIPARIREMSLKQFVEEYNGDISSFVQNDKEKEYHRLSSSPTTKCMKSDDENDPNQVPSTVVMTARRKRRAKNEDEMEVSQVNNVLATPKHSKQKENQVFQTPKINSTVPCTPKTLKKAVQNGEGLYSASGSPISMGSLVATLDGSGTTITKAHPNKNGVMLDLSNPLDQKELSNESRQQAREEIQDLQRKLAALLNQLE